MKRRAIVTPRAQADLLEIGAYIARDNPAAADRLIDKLAAKGQLLAEHPGIGSPHPQVPRSELRYIPVGIYLLFYRETAEGIEVVRYVHGRRNLPDVL